MNYIRAFSRALSKFLKICYGLLEFSENLFYRTPLDVLYVLEALVLSNWGFFLGIFLFKESSGKTRTFILTFMIRRNSTTAFHHVFMITFYALTLQKLFLLTKLKNLISLKWHTFNIKHYVNKTYLHIKVFLLGSFDFLNKKTTVPEKKTISRSLLKNLIL